MVWLAVATGGALGSMARHAVNHVIHGNALVTRFPLGTAAVNLVGCFVIGLLAGALASDRIVLRASWREFVFVGLLGGFTTFSTFGLDTDVRAGYVRAGPDAVHGGGSLERRYPGIWRATRPRAGYRSSPTCEAPGTAGCGFGSRAAHHFFRSAPLDLVSKLSRVRVNSGRATFTVPQYDGGNLREHETGLNVHCPASSRTARRRC